MRFTNMMNPLWITLALVGCVAGPEDIEDLGDPEVEPSPEIGEASLCFYSTTPPTVPSGNAYDLDAFTGAIFRTVSSYGTTECASAVFGFENPGQFSAKVTSTTTDPDACVNTVLTLHGYSRDYSGWDSYVREVRGEYTANGCVLPSVYGSISSLPYPSEVRWRVKARRTTCYSSGICAIQYGLPLQLHVNSQAQY